MNTRAGERSLVLIASGRRSRRWRSRRSIAPVCMPGCRAGQSPSSSATSRARRSFRAEHGAAYGDLRAEHRRLLREALEAHGGHEIDAEGRRILHRLRACDRCRRGGGRRSANARGHGRCAGTNGPAHHRAASSSRWLCRRWSQPRGTDMRGCARWPDRRIARHRRHRRGRRATRRPTARPRRSLSEGHLATTAAVPDRRRRSSVRVPAAWHQDRRRDDRDAARHRSRRLAAASCASLATTARLRLPLHTTASSPRPHTRTTASK